MIFLFFSILQLVSLILSYRISRNIFSLLFLSTLVLSFNFIGTLILSDFCAEGCLASFYISLGTFLLVFGGVIASKLTKPSIKTLTKLNKIKVKCSNNQLKIFLYTLSIITFITLILATLLFIKKGIPLLSKNIVEAKQLLPRDAEIYFMASMHFLPFLSVLWMSCAFSTQEKLIKIATIFVVLISAIFLLFWGHKGSTFGFIILILMFLSIKLRKSFKNTATLTLILIFGLVSIIYVSQIYVTKWGGNSPFTSAIQYVFSRMTSEAAEGFFTIVNKFLQKEGLQYGKTIINAFKSILATLRLVPREGIKVTDLDTGIFLMEWARGYNPLNYAFTITVFGDFIINFGFPGLIILSFLLGVFIQKLYILTLKYSKDLFIFPSLIFTQFILFNLVDRGPIGGAISGLFFPFFIIFMILITVFIILSLPTGQVRYKLYKFHSKKDIL